MLKSYLDEFAKDAIKTLEMAQADLAHLLQSVRIVVGAKSKRFFDALGKLPQQPDPAKTFFDITQPRMQIKQLISAVHGYFQIKVDPNAIERVKISLMKPDGADLVFTDWAPEADVPNSRYARFRGNTIAGLAFSTRRLVISENVANDVRFFQFITGKDQGSMFAYPVIDSLLDEVVYVINVMASKTGQFQDTPSERQKIEKVMEIYAERMVLENRLDRIKTEVSAKQDGGVG